MEENGKKRNRKSKLVPRDCMDSDDENIADMQKEIEAYLVQMKNKNILKKLSKPTEPKPLQFSVKVEVEELSEQRDAEKNLSIRIDSVTSLSETTSQPVPSTSNSEVPYLRISDEILRMEFENLSRVTTSQADKRIEMNMRNLLGRKKKTLQWNHVDEKLQNLFRRKWTNWRNTFPHIRESPLLYKCDKCNKAWWHLHDFREHLLAKHKVSKKMTIQFQTSCHECYFVAYNGYKPEAREERRVKSNCWRCGKDIESHLVSVCEKSARYRCVGCLEKFYTCTLLFDHESVCPLYKQFKLQSALFKEIYACTQCPAKLCSDTDLLDHMRLRHSVRSDLPTDWVLRPCNDCNYPFHLQILHDCPFKPAVTSCQFCSQRFTSSVLSTMHMNLTKKNYPCKECGLVLRSQCMELEHMMKHTKNYIFAYKCLHCTESLYFPNMYTVNKHKFTAHRGQNDSRNPMNSYDTIVIPKRMAAILPGFEQAQRQKESATPNKSSPAKCFDSALDGLLGSLSDPPGHSMARCSDKLQRKASISIKNLSTKNKMKRPNKKVDRPPKKPKHQHEEAIVDITLRDSSQDEEVEVEIVENPEKHVVIDISSQEDDEIDLQTSEGQQKIDIIDIRTPDSLQENDINMYVNLQQNDKNNVIEDKSQNEYNDNSIDHTQENDSDNVHMSEQLQGSENTKEISTGNIIDIPLTEINKFDPYLVIKEEITDCNDTIDYTQQETEAIGEIKIENVMKIKEEALDIVQEEDNIISINSNKDTKSFCINETLIAQTDNSQLKTDAKNDKLANDIQELKTIKNDTFRAKIDEERVITACKKPVKTYSIMITTNDSGNLKDNIDVTISSSNIDDNDKLKTTIVTLGNDENDVDKLKTNNDKSKVNIATLKNDENDVDKLKTNNDKLRANTVTLRNDENDLVKFKTNNDKLKANTVKLRNDENDVVKLKTNNDKLRANTVTLRNDENDVVKLKTNNDKLRANTVTLRNDENDVVKLKTTNDKLRANTVTLKNDVDKLKTINEGLRATLTELRNYYKLDDNNENETDNKTQQLDIQIKEEMDAQDFYDNFEVAEEIINFKIKEENIDELIEHDMIILDPSNCVDVKYEMVPSSTTSMTSEVVDPKTQQSEVIVCHSYGKRVYRCTKCNFKGFHHQYKQHLQEEGHFASKRKYACLHRSKPVHLVQTTDTDGSTYGCTSCGVVYSSFYKYTKHLSKVHNYQKRACPKCLRTFPSMQSLQSHIHTHVKEIFVNIYLIKNKEEDDNELVTHQCKTCSKKVTVGDFFKHWESHLNILDNTAKSHASKGFSPSVEHKHELKKMLLLIQGIHPPAESEDDSQYTRLKSCLKCKRKFERRNECKRHYIEHLLSDAYQEREHYGFLRCQICSTDFYTSERYKRHMREHASLPIYKCELCDKAFSDSSNFTKHKKVHNLSVLICDICKKKFTGKQFLEKHIMLHQKIKPLECQECKKVFYTESSYRKHISRGRTRFKCPFCHVFFTSLRDKWDHMWEIHKERKFIADCPLCKKSFRKHQDVRHHIRYEHRDRNFKYIPDRTILTNKEAARPRLKAVGKKLVVMQPECE